jgi:pimeloyl-ACP methyl ester carboxylesterase
MNKPVPPATTSSVSRRTAGKLLAGTAVGAGLAASGLVSQPAAASNRRNTFAPSSGQLTTVGKAYANGPFGQIHFRYAGDASSAETPLMCLHASPLSGILYDYWLAEMAKDRFCLAPDTPGYGGSDAPVEAPLIGDLADAMIGFMDSVGLQTVDVMGYHTGSFISADLAMRYPARIRKVVMISAPIFDHAIIEDYRARIYDAAPPLHEVLASTAKNLRENGRGMFRDMSDERYEDVSLERLRNFRTVNWGFRAAFAYDLTETLPQVEQPILILNPEDDLWELTPRAKPFLNNGRIHDLPGWTHGHLDAHTEEMAEIVRAFLAE